MSSTFLLGGDLPVNRIGFGAMRLAADGIGRPARDPETAKAVLRRAVELGVNHIDTAAFYVSGDRHVRANSLIHDALRPYRDDLVIAVKVGPVLGSDGRMRLFSEPSELRAAVEANLRELGLERLDIVYLRAGGGMGPHPGQPISDHFEALAELRRAGLIRHLALSNVTREQFAEAGRIAPVVAVQNNFHSGNRDDADLMRECERLGVAFVPFLPLGGGRADVAHESVRAVADRHGATVPQIALAWLLATSPAILTIPGTGSLAHLAENMAARAITLTPDDLALLA